MLSAKRPRRHSFSSLPEVERELQQPTACNAAASTQPRAELGRSRSDRKRPLSPGPVDSASVGSLPKKLALGPGLELLGSTGAAEASASAASGEDFLCLPGGQ